MTKTTTPPQTPRPTRPTGMDAREHWELTGRWEWREGWWNRVIVWVEEDRIRPLRNTTTPGIIDHARDVRWRRAKIEDWDFIPRQPRA